MELIERVADTVRFERFKRNGRGTAYDPETPLHETELADAKAAIRAMLNGVEPCAWAYINSDGECEQIDFGGVQPQPEFTALYSLDALKEAL